MYKSGKTFGIATYQPVSNAFQHFFLLRAAYRGKPRGLNPPPSFYVTQKRAYTQKGERKALEIPAGTDLSSLLDENGYIGFSRLAEHYAVPYVYGKN